MVEGKGQVKNKGLIPGFTRLEEARKRREENKSGTNRYSFGDPIVDDYLGGGWGRQNGYELICIFGDTGMNKSTFISQMAISAVKRGAKVAYLALEDEIEDVVDRIDRQICGSGSGLSKENESREVLQNIDFLPENDGYTLEALADFIEELFTTWDVVFVDPLQFVFEASMVDKGETEWNRQRVFLRRLNNIMKKNSEEGKVLVFVSHTNKGGNFRDRAEMGMQKLQGSTAIQQICTKVIEIGRTNEGLRSLRLWKTRFTRYRKNGLQISLEDNSLRIGFDTSGLTQSQILEMKENW